jgi:glycosyltransferase involved in cell wall biosynthesis
MKYRVILFQPYLRQFIFNFGEILKKGEFTNKSANPTRTLYQNLPNFDEEINRMKTTNWRCRLRRFFGIPNIRIRYEKEGDILFTYGTLLITNKPYCTYLETGLSFYNYDLQIGKHPLARLIVSLLAMHRNCHSIIFLSEAARKSFFASLWYPKFVREQLEKKMIVIYPLPLIETTAHPPKTLSGALKILFVGMFYMKGGVELVKAFERLQKQYPNIELTIVTPLHTVKQEDIDWINSISHTHLQDAILKAEEMRNLYRNHHIFCLPTYRDGFGLVLIEAIAHGMPLIITDQYATSEMVDQGENGFVFRYHPLLDHVPETYQILGKYYNPKFFYTDLFRFQKEGQLKSIENFLYQSIEQFLIYPELLEAFSKHSLALYQKKFHPEIISNQLETIFLNAFYKK